MYKLMNIKLLDKIDEYLQCSDYYLLGSSAVYCENRNKKGYKDMLLINDLSNGSDSVIGTMLWRSKDDGATWEEQGFLEKSYIYDFNNSSVKSGYGALFSDEKTGVVIFFANDTYWEKGEIKSLWKKRTLYYRLSFDNGYTWTDKKYVVQKGSDSKGISYDHIHFLKDVNFGKNMAASVTPLIIRADDNSLLVSVQVQITDDSGELTNPTGMGFMKCGALKGLWNEEKLDYVWELGDYASVGPEMSTRGVYEPTFGKIGKDSYIMVMRGSNMGMSDKIDGIKFYSISNNNGLTWSMPAPLKYDDGSTMYSSSTIPKLILHSNGRLYFIGIINKENPNGNLPRYPLCIAEVDTQKLCIIKDTVTVLDTKRAFHDDTIKGANNIDFSNHGVYEDEKTGENIVFAPFRTDLTRYGSVINKYVVKVKS
jgi:hypothetical protein